MRRIVSLVDFTIINRTIRRHVHDIPLPPTVGNVGSLSKARSSLLHLNVLLRSGEKIDAKTYTQAIAVMAEAKLEWQAYKLFARMLEEGVRPLPETYLALRDATIFTRKRIINEIDAKIRDTSHDFPKEVLDDVISARDNESSTAAQLLQVSLSGELPVLEEREETLSSPPPLEVEEGNAVMHIRNPTETWATHNYILEEAERRKALVDSARRPAMEQKLMRVGHDELKIFLAIHRQLRNGEKQDLIDRVITNISEKDITEMLNRRDKYFANVEEATASDHHEADVGNEHKSIEQKSHDKLVDAFKASPKFLYTPWGRLRKPPKGPAIKQPSTKQTEDLSSAQMEEISRAAALGGIDEIPAAILRRYARMFRLKWRRIVRGSLGEAVSWHVLNVHRQGTSIPVVPTQSQIHDEELVAANKTLESFEVFKLISHRTKNLRIVDSKEINLSSKNAYNTQQRRNAEEEEISRRERHVSAAMSLKKSARSFHRETVEKKEPLRVLGLIADKMEAEDVKELPPWAVQSASQPFNLTQGTFGDAKMGRYMEMNDGRFRPSPVHEAQQKYSIDAGFLSASEREEVEDAKELIEEEDVIKQHREAQRNESYRYRRFKSFIDRSKKRIERMKDEDDIVKPVREQERMSRVLRKGKQMVKLNSS